MSSRRVDCWPQRRSAASPRIAFQRTPASIDCPAARRNGVAQRQVCCRCFLPLIPYRPPTPDHPHHQQQAQQTFHVQLLRSAYPDATNREAAAAACGQQPDPHRRQEATTPTPAQMLRAKRHNLSLIYIADKSHSRARSYLRGQQTLLRRLLEQIHYWSSKADRFASLESCGQSPRSPWHLAEQL